MSVLRLDWETKSEVDLSKSGAYKYAEDASTDIHCGSYAFDDEEPTTWYAGQPVPARVAEHIIGGGEIRAWNAQFERLLMRAVAVPRYGWPEPRLDQYVCTMAEAAAMSLPLALGQCAEVLGIDEQKDAEGRKTMIRHCKPKKWVDGVAVWHELTPAELLVIGAYCEQDVRTERSVERCLRPLTPREREIYLLDQRLNDRGVYVDLDLAAAARRIADIGIARANLELAELTGGKLDAVTKGKAMVGYLNEHGVDTDGVSKKVVRGLLEGELPADQRRILELRADAGRSSLAKLDVMPVAACADSRVRGLVQYHAASTGRWGGRLLQPQNFARPEDADPERYIDDVMAGNFDLIDVMHKSPIAVVVDLLRSMLTAGPGMELVAGDFSSVEAVVLNWLADERAVLDDFRAYLKGDKSRDPYKVMAVKMGRAASVGEVAKQDRQAGKAAELGCGFGMGDGKFVTAAWDVYGVRVTPEQSKDAVRIYRDTHPNVKAFWYETNAAAIDAVENAGKVVTFGGLKNLKYVVQGAYLYCILPAKRPLCYARPKVEMAPPPWGGEDRPQLTYAGKDPFTKKWGRIRTYGGHLVENIVQAVARDLMADAMLRAEQRGYAPVMTVHDEIVAEVPFGFGSVQEFETLMAEVPEWAAGCPVGAEGWRGVRYRK